MPSFPIDYLPLISLAGWLAMFAMKRRSLFAGDCAGLVYHLALLPVVRFLPGGPEVVFAGYLWLFSDALVDIISINGAGRNITWAFRMGAHLFACIWITGTSMLTPGPMLYIGIPLGLGLGIHAIFCAKLERSKQILTVPVIPMMTAWLLAMAWHFHVHPV